MVQLDEPEMNYFFKDFRLPLKSVMDKTIYLFINPPVEDFACTNYFSIPFGMLRTISHFRSMKKSVLFYDFLHEDFAFSQERFIRKKNGLIEYPQAIATKPPALERLHRRYRRFGNELDSFTKFIENQSIDWSLCKIIINTDFSYRAMGTLRFLEWLVHHYPIKYNQVVLGGIGAELIPGYYRQYSDELSIAGDNMHPATRELFLSVSEDTLPYLDFYRQLDFLPFRINPSCPYRCDYCASHFLANRAKRANKAESLSAGSLKGYFMNNRRRFKTDILAAYDDALLYQLSLLESSLEGGSWKVYTPNGLHLHKISTHVAARLKKLGFQQLRFGIETLENRLQDLSDQKLDRVNIKNKVHILKNVGFQTEQIRFYIMYGLPGQTFEQVMATIECIEPTGCPIHVSGYAPVPHTVLYEKLDKDLNGLLSRSPELTNNSAVSLWNKLFTESRIWEIKKRCRR